MAQAANDLESSAGVIKGIQSQLGSHKAEVLGAWGGNAARAFDNVFNQFDEDFRKVLQALEGMHGTLSQTRMTYEAQEQASQESVNRVQNLLGGG
jgi:ESAT-6 family protein